MPGHYSVNDCEEMETIHAIWSHQNPFMGQKRAAVNLGARNDGELKLARTPMKQVKEINPHGRTYSKTRPCSIVDGPEVPPHNRIELAAQKSRNITINREMVGPLATNLCHPMCRATKKPQKREP